MRSTLCLSVVTISLAASAIHADVLFNNGPIVTNPTGGTGAIAGQPISQAEGFTVPGNPFVFSTTGVAATFGTSTAAADNFVVPAGGWDLDSVTLFAFQTSQTTPTIHTIRVNLWSAPPFSAGSPPPLPEPLPVPLLATPLVLDAGEGAFLCHRQSPSGTSTVRPVFAYTVSLDALPNGGMLPAGAYWLEFSFEGASTPSANVFTPLVTPRADAFDTNARLLNSLDGNPNSPRVWFEGREGFVPNVSDGRAYALPFVLHGTPIPAPACAPLLGVAALAFSRRRAGSRRGGR